MVKVKNLIKNYWTEEMKELVKERGLNEIAELMTIAYDSLEQKVPNYLAKMSYEELAIYLYNKVQIALEVEQQVKRKLLQLVKEGKTPEEKATLTMIAMRDSNSAMKDILTEIPQAMIEKEMQMQEEISE